MKNDPDVTRGPVLIAAPLGKDASLAADVLGRGGIAAQICSSLLEIAEQMSDQTAALLVAEEALLASDAPLLLDVLSQQPAWSDIPLIILTSANAGDELSLRVLEIFGPKANITLLERPLGSVTLITSIEGALRARQRQYEVRYLLEQRETALNSISDAFAALDGEWRYIYVNDRAAEYAAMRRDEMIGRTIWEIYPDARGGNFHTHALRARETKQPQSFEQYYEKLGCWLETHIYPSGDGIVVFRANINQRKRAEGALREKEEFVRLLLDSAADGFYGVDREGSTTICNAAFLRMLGFAREEDVIGKKLHDVIHHSHPDGSCYPKEECPIYQTARNGKPAHIDDELFYRHDGSSFPVEYWAYPILRNGELCGAVTTFIDITERREAEIALRRAKREAEEANNAKDKFLAVLSHELRTPLTPVLMTIATLQRDPVIGDELRKDLELIQRNVGLEARLIDDLLDLTRVAHGKLELQKDAIDIHHVIDHALSISAGDIQEKNLSVTRDYAAPEHHSWADAARVQQVFWNLIKNAVKFTPAGGRLEIKTRTESSQIVVEITDTGIGIEPEHLSRIFDAFEQGSRTITASYGGLGLGLAIAKRVIDLHGGIITARSEGIDRGATFAIKLPVTATSLLDGPIYLLDPKRGSSQCRILLVEDHEDTARVLRRILLAAGHTVTVAGSIETAKGVVAINNFDLVISDLGLPDGSGLDLMRHVRDQHHLPGIALSGFGMEEDVRLSKAAGFSEHLTKPVDWEQLKKAIERVARCGAERKEMSGDAA